MNAEAGGQGPWGVPEGFREFFRTYEPRVRKFLRWYGAERCHEDDVVQLTMQEALRHFKKVRDLDQPQYWLFKVARQRLARLVDDQGRHGWPTRPEDLPHQEFHDRRYDLVEAQDSPVFAALAELSPVQREAVLLHAFGVTHQEIAELQNIRVSSARSRVSRGHEHLRSLLDGAQVAGGSGT